MIMLMWVQMCPPNLRMDVTNKLDIATSLKSFDAFSLFCMLFKQYRIKNILSPRGIKPRAVCLTHKCSATEPRPPAGKQTFQFCIYTVKGLQSHSQQTNQNSIFQRLFLYVELFYSTILSVAERLCFKQVVLCLISVGNQIFFNSVLLKKKPMKEREYI